jgi:hypothetical protein
LLRVFQTAPALGHPCVEGEGGAVEFHAPLRVQGLFDHVDFSALRPWGYPT